MLVLHVTLAQYVAAYAQIGAVVVECGLSGNPDNVVRIPLFMVCYQNPPDLDCSVI